jgi:hypothetical protein
MTAIPQTAAPPPAALAPAGPAPGLTLPAPPNDAEKYAYTDRNLAYLATTLLISACCLTISQIRFEMHGPAGWLFVIFTATYVATS